MTMIEVHATLALDDDDELPTAAEVVAALMSLGFHVEDIDVDWQWI